MIPQLLSSMATSGCKPYSSAKVASVICWNSMSCSDISDQSDYIRRQTSSVRCETCFHSDVIVTSQAELGRLTSRPPHNAPGYIVW